MVSLASRPSTTLSREMDPAKEREERARLAVGGDQKNRP